MRGEGRSKQQVSRHAAPSIYRLYSSSVLHLKRNNTSPPTLCLRVQLAISTQLLPFSIVHS